MNQNQINQLNQLFNKFAQEEQASSFAVQDLLNKTLKIVQQGDANDAAQNVTQDIPKDD